MNRTLLVSFVECFGTPEFLVSFNFRYLELNDFLYRVLASTGAPTGASRVVLTKSFQHRTSEQFSNWFAVNEDRVLREFGTEEGPEMLPVAFSVFTYS